MRKFIKYLLIALPLVLPALAWAYVKPVRVVAPQLAGLTCDEQVCVDDVARLDEAKALYANAIRFVQTKVGAIRSVPRAMFCADLPCSRHFGLHEGAYAGAGAYNVGTLGVVISHRGWHPYFVRHELIHHVQNERLGSLNAWFFKPDWFKEGMAYTASQDPRLPFSGVLNSYTARYSLWAEGRSMAEIWSAAEAL